MFVGKIYLGALRDNERKADSFETWALAFDEGAFCARQDEFADRASLRSCLLFQPPV
jgi:hypothetical protein